MEKLKYVVVLSALFLSFFVTAERDWAATLTEWTLSLNNDVACITSAQFASHCKYS